MASAASSYLYPTPLNLTTTRHIRPHSPLIPTISRPPLSVTHTHQPFPSLLPLRSSRTVLPPPPPSSREEAVIQAKNFLLTALKKPLKMSSVIPAQVRRKLTQPRFRVEIPLAENSPNSLATLAFEFFSVLPIARNRRTVRTSILWSDPTAAGYADRLFDSSETVSNHDLSSTGAADLSLADLIVFLAPGASGLDRVRSLCDAVYPRPVVLLNPDWGFEEEEGFARGLGSFVASFEVVYSFFGWEVQGTLNRWSGAMLRNAGEPWVMMVEDGKTRGEMRVVSRFQSRPTMKDMENVLYNLTAANSLLTKSVKFISDMVSSVFGKKDN